MRQQFVDAAAQVRGQPCENILQIRVEVVPVHARRLDQAHDGGRTLARAKATGEQPVAPANRNLGVILRLLLKNGVLSSCINETGVIRWQMCNQEESTRRNSMWRLCGRSGQAILVVARVSVDVKEVVA